jgi:carboxyl-terminal processing protease
MFSICRSVLFLLFLAFTNTASAQSYSETLDTIWSLARDKFVNAHMNGIDWPSVRREFGSRAAKARSEAEFSHVAGEMLGLLGTSHTAYLSPDDPMLPVLLDVYRGNPDLQRLIDSRYGEKRPQLTGIGIFTRQIEGKTFVDLILDGSPADKVGLKIGDEIVSVDDLPIDRFRTFDGKGGTDVQLAIRRGRDEQPRIVVVNVETDAALDVVDGASRNSIRQIERDGKKIAYVRFWSMAGTVVEDLAAEMPLADTDALVIDVRGLVGGGGPNLLDLLDPRTGKVCFATRSRTSCGPDSFRGRTVLLTDEHTRSAAEMLAHAFRRDDFGVIVGARTAGAVSGGQLFPLANGGAVYLAVSKLTIDGLTLEGTGVAPDRTIGRPLPYSAGADPQLDAAIETASCLAARKGSAACR